jgi:hypothetical protein
MIPAAYFQAGKPMNFVLKRHLIHPLDNGVPKRPDGFKNSSQPRICIILSQASAPPSSGRTRVMP